MFPAMPWHAYLAQIMETVASAYGATLFVIDFRICSVVSHEMLRLSGLAHICIPLSDFLALRGFVFPEQIEMRVAIFEGRQTDETAAIQKEFVLSQQPRDSQISSSAPWHLPLWKPEFLHRWRCETAREPSPTNFLK